MDLIGSGLECLRQQRYAEAEALGRRALALAPGSAAALNVLALALNGLDKFAEAAPLLQHLTGLEPSRAAHWVNLGSVLRASGALDQALDAYQQAARLGEQSGDFLYSVGLLQLDRGAYDEARRTLRVAAGKLPRDAEVIYHYAQAAFECVKASDAIAVLLAWRDLEGLNPELLAKIGTLLMQLSESAEAEAALTLALQQDSSNARTLLRMAGLLERNNRIDEAGARLAALKPDALESEDLADELLAVQANLAHRRGDFMRARALYEKLLSRDLAPHRRHEVLYPLAKTLDLLGEHDQAMAALDDAHAAQLLLLERAAPGYAASAPPPLSIVEFGADASDVARWDNATGPDPAQSPIFIVAFPRSGTTLLEQMLDAHPLLCSMDEQPFLQSAIGEIGRLGVRYPEGLAEMSAGQCDQARALYWNQVRTKVKLSPGQRLVDKNPFNILRLAAIRRLFPRSRIILAIRHPCDVILSCYMQHFRAPEVVLMCRNLATLASSFSRAFDFWYGQCAVLEPTVLELQYESFVTDLDAHAREVASFLDLPWHDAMLRPGDHAQRRGFISTPSYSQVVQPVNRRAVDRWRRYEKYLVPVIPQLQPYLDRWGYQ